jgi:hypothetical protein
VNLHAVVGQAVASVNPMIPVAVRVSTGQSAANPDGTRSPVYATPGSFTGSIDATVLTVTAVGSGVVQVGQAVSGAGVLPGTVVTKLKTGSGGVGTYEVNREQSVASAEMTTALTLLAQIQPMTWRDLQQVDGLNVQGVRWKVYLSGEVDGMVRSEKKGGDLVIVPAGSRHAGTWLVTQVLEQFPDWVCAAITLQNAA